MDSVKVVLVLIAEYRKSKLFTKTLLGISIKQTPVSNMRHMNKPNQNGPGETIGTRIRSVERASAEPMIQ
jgi:hypothetical protein